MARFGRVLTAMVTPFREDLSLDLDEAQRLARYLADNGSDGLVVAGSTGESATLGHEEKIALFRAVKDAVGSSARVIAGTGTYSTADSIDLTREAEKAGADGVLVVTPYYNKPPQRGLLEHFRAVAESSRLPMIVYNIPSRTVIRIELDTLLALAEHPNIVAVKESTGDFGFIGQLAERKPADFEIYSGDDPLTLPMQTLGAVGVVSVLSHVAGPRIQDQFARFESGDIAGARAVHEQLLPLFRALFCTSNPIPVKAAMRLLGFKVGPPRPPLYAATPEEEATVRKALEGIGAI
jgi:4-hydroxy-tetrahydrodipicolinate synthase